MTTYAAADLTTKNVRTTGDGSFNEAYSYTHPSGGILAGSIIRYGIIPAGVEVHSVKHVHDAGTASETQKLGYQYVNGTGDGATVDDYWFGATAVTTAGSTVSAAHPKTFNNPVYIIGTTAGATSTAASVSDVVVTGKNVGVP